MLKESFVETKMFVLRYLKKKFIGVYLLYCVVLVSAVLQSESVICVYISPLFLDFLPIQDTTEH